jgi:quinol monooxygenase YgiN
MSALITMALYQPHEGKEEQLNEVLRNHIKTLETENLITSREPIRARAANGTVIEIFEWRSEQAKDAAHESPGVMRVWNEIMEIAEIKSLSSLDEANHPFPNFAPYSV